jgi:hypothetical protein
MTSSSQCYSTLIRSFTRLLDSISDVLMFLSDRKVKSFDVHSARAMNSNSRPPSMALAIGRQFLHALSDYSICRVFDWRTHPYASGKTSDLDETVTTGM